MPVPFGIGIGDFLSVGSLAVRIARALDDSRGATSDYKALTELLRSLSTSLTVIGEFVTKASFASAVQPEQAFVRGIQHHLACCGRLMEEFQATSSKYTELLVNGKGRRVKQELKKIGWCLFRDDDVRKLHQKLQGHLEAFQIYMIAVGWSCLTRSAEKQDGISDSVTRMLALVTTGVKEGSETHNRMHSSIAVLSSQHRESSEMVQRILAIVSESFELIKTTRREIPKTLGHAWEGSEQPVVFEDALGVSTALPPILCQTKERFHDVLLIMFRDRPWRDLVEHGDYEVLEKSTDATITASAWEQKLLPGMRIAMNIMLYTRERKPAPKFQQEHRCPKCGGLNYGSGSQRTVTCRSCALVFRTTGRERQFKINLLEPPPARPGRVLQLKKWKRCDAVSDTRIATHSASKQCPQSRPEDEYLNIFRRIHFVHEVMHYHVPEPAPHMSPTGFESWQASTIPLRRAAGKNDLSWVRRLLEDGTILHDQDSRLSEWTALQYASHNRNLPMCHILLEHGADINAAPALSRGKTALQAMCAVGDEFLAGLLLAAGAEVNAPACKFYGRTALQAAAEMGHEDIVKLLLGSGADVNAPAAYCGMTALQAASHEGYEDITQLLLDPGANANAPPSTETERTALQSAVEKNHVSIVVQLLKAGANINAPPAPVYGKTALQAACARAREDLIYFLLLHGADVNAPLAPTSGTTALQAACLACPVHIVEVLLHAGADVNAPPAPTGGKTALQEACERGDERLVLLLLSHGADVDAAAAADSGKTALQAACARGHERIVRVLLEKDADVNAPPAPQWGRTALQAACARTSVRLVRLLVDNGADVNAPAAEGSGKTALQAACRQGHEGIVRVLLEAGANVDAPPAREHGETALEAAAGFERIVHLLQAARAEG